MKRVRDALKSLFWFHVWTFFFFSSFNILTLILFSFVTRHRFLWISVCIFCSLFISVYFHYFSLFIVNMTFTVDSNVNKRFRNVRHLWVENLKFEIDVFVTKSSWRRREFNIVKQKTIHESATFSFEKFKKIENIACDKTIFRDCYIEWLQWLTYLQSFTFSKNTKYIFVNKNSSFKNNVFFFNDTFTYFSQNFVDVMNQRRNRSKNDQILFQHEILQKTFYLWKNTKSREKMFHSTKKHQIVFDNFKYIISIFIINDINVTNLNSWCDINHIQRLNNFMKRM